MELIHNIKPSFTEWVVATGLLETPYVHVDVGCQFGPQKRWAALGECLEWHGIDPLKEAIEGMPVDPIPGAKIVSHELAVGDQNG